jgi:hypothetical protein
MRGDFYTRALLTIAAVALVYLCVAVTAFPAAHAQRAARPGDDTGPARCLIVGWDTADRVPVQVLDSITLKTTGDMRISGTVQTEQKPNSVERVVLAGWEQRGSDRAAGPFRAFDADAKNPALRGVPVTVYNPW